MSALLKRLQQALHQLPLLVKANSTMGLLSPTIAWVDDIALPLPCVEATDLDVLLQHGCCPPNLQHVWAPTQLYSR